MEWTRLDLGGRITTLGGSACAGVTADGDALVARLDAPDPVATVVAGVLLDSFGVLGVAVHEGRALTGRSQDGRLCLWRLDGSEDPGQPQEHPLDPAGTMWAAPVPGGCAPRLLASYAGKGAWWLRTDVLEADGVTAKGRELRLGGPPDGTVSYGVHGTGLVVVAGEIGDGPAPAAAAWVLEPGDPHRRHAEETDWRRVHLAPTPSELSAVASNAAGRRTWMAGRVDDRPVVYELLPLPFRGLMRSQTVSLPGLTLAPKAIDGPFPPVVLVADGHGDHPVLVVATSAGNRLCWLGADGWKAHPVPDGRVGGACIGGRRVHVLVDGTVWSLPDPT